MKFKYYLLALFLFVFSLNFKFMEAVESQNTFNEEFLKFIAFRPIGPARQGGRILHIVVSPKDPYTFYVAPSTGGLWKTVNNGTTFESILPEQSNVPIGHVALAASNPDIIWVGTGDPASGRIPLRGHGVYKSVDAGRTWKYMGLKETAHIGRIAIHPHNPDIVYVAAVGYHFSFSQNRGLYKTVDGGQSWEKILYINERAGIVDVALNPQNPDIVFAAAYDKTRIPWNFDDFGPESGIYKSVDGGKSWKRLVNGLPTGRIGRIGLAVYPKNPNIIYANITNFNTRPPTEEEVKQAQKLKMKPKEVTIGGEVYRSEDAGETWKKVSPDGYSLGGGKWYGQIYVDPNNDQIIYVMDTSLYRSTDSGKTWGKERPENIAQKVHVDHHALWIDPQNSNHLILGNDGGLAVSYDFGKTWDVYDNLPLAQYYAIGVDMDEPYNIYGGTQDNGSLKVPSNSLRGQITRDDCVSVGGGDGMYNQVDPNDSRWLYNASQLGAIQRVDQKTGLVKNIRPSPAKGEPPYRFNWTAPIHISPHISQVIYLGANVLLRSVNRGDTWHKISPDLTTNDPEKLKGNIEFCTITTISESPLVPGVIWVGTDDGKVQVTKNGGATWLDRTENLEVAGAPRDYYVSRVFASHHQEGKAYITKTGFQRDDYRPFVFMTEDFGETWQNITGNLPEGTVYVIAEDRKKQNLLFVGTEMSVFVSIDGGKKWVKLANNLPDNALVHDLVIHPRENDLIVATHGRGLFIADITVLQELSDKVLDEDFYLFDIEPKIQWTYRRSTFDSSAGHRIYVAENEPIGLFINYYFKKEIKDKVKITIKDLYGEVVNVLEGKGEAGVNCVLWDMRRPTRQEEVKERADRREGMDPLVPPGEYLVVLEMADKKITKRALIRKMPGT